MGVGGVSHDDKLDHPPGGLQELDPFIMAHLLQGMAVDVSDLVVDSQLAIPKIRKFKREMNQITDSKEFHETGRYYAYVSRLCVYSHHQSTES